MPDTLAVLYADAHLLVLNKPAGLLCVPGRGPDKQDCLSTRAQHHYPGALVVHRLDMATSGLVVMARTAPAQRALSRAFEERRVHKRYQAVVHGTPLPAPHQASPDSPWHTIDLPIMADWPRRPLRVIAPPGTGQPSTTRWRCTRTNPAHNSSLLELEPLTGRTHQLRVHLQALGHPIWGDALYAPAAIAASAPRLLLHACQLALAHPHSGQTMQWHSPAPWAA